MEGGWRFLNGSEPPTLVTIERLEGRIICVPKFGGIVALGPRKVIGCCWCHGVNAPWCEIYGPDSRRGDLTLSLDDAQQRFAVPNRYLFVWLWTKDFGQLFGTKPSSRFQPDFNKRITQISPIYIHCRSISPYVSRIFLVHPDFSRVCTTHPQS